MYDFDYILRFEITDKETSLEEAVGLMDSSPTVFIKKGEVRRNRFGQELGRVAVVSHISWQLHTEKTLSSEATPIKVLVTEFCSKLSTRLDLLRTLKANGANVRLEIALKPVESYCVCTLDLRLLSQLSSLGIEVDFCLVAPPGMLA